MLVCACMDPSYVQAAARIGFWTDPGFPVHTVLYSMDCVANPPVQHRQAWFRSRMSALRQTLPPPSSVWRTDTAEYGANQ